MSNPKRQVFLIAVMLVLLALVAGWSVNRMRTARYQAQREARYLAECEAYAKRIKTLRDKPAVASAQKLKEQKLGPFMSEAWRKAGLPGSPPETVSPKAARRIGDSPYKRKPTAIPMRRIALPDLTSFLYHLTDGTGLRVRELRLTAPDRDSHNNRWDAQVTVTYLVHEPRDESRAGAPRARAKLAVGDASH